MKNILTILSIVASSLILTGCGNDKFIDGKHVEVYGFANIEANKDPNVIYEISAGSVICAIFFSETIIVPIYVIGWDLWQPVRKRTQ